MKIRNESIIATTLTILLLGGVSLVYFDWNDATEIAAVIATDQEQTTSAADPIVPLPLELSLDIRKVALGKRLFNDPGLSGDGSLSCVHCHNLATGGVDRLARSRGIGGKEGGINAPTVFNSGFNFRQFWDGRAETLDDQVDGPLQHPLEMGGTWPQVIATLSGDPLYHADFKDIYRDGIAPPNVKDAIATFERSLITPNSRLDRFLRGDHSALNEEELAGYRLFKQNGCTSCHQGVNIGGNMYQKLSIMEDYFAVRGNMSEADQGRFNVTKREQDRHFFKVPSLRNVAVTPPYLHDGSAGTLEDSVNVMARYQLGTEFNAAEVARIVAFLRTLTGEYQGQPLK
ncbi:cytochrome-c peroxidase [Propionivibrio sp.]|uniref:cytochrome-c peroxidase n=1 Tax=Propionivibrio sp. TaxID=2212460 RepID=UPI003BEF643B